MSCRFARAAALAAALACLLPAGGAWAQDPAGPGSQPPLSEDPPSPLNGNGPEPAPTPEPTPSPGGREERELPATGADALLTALAGLGLVAAGAGVRLTVPRADDRLAS